MTRTLQDGGLVLCAVILSAIHDVARRRVIDIAFDDEAGALAAGLAFFRDGPPPATELPLYACWYWCVSVIASDPITVYYVNWALLTCLLLSSLSMVLGTLGIPRMMRLAVLLGASTLAYFEEVPYVSLLAGSLVLIAVGAAIRARFRSDGLSRAAAVLALAIFVRPELILTAAVSTVAATAAAIRERRCAWVGGPIVVFLFLSSLFGVPFGEDRHDVAFAQHYAFNVVHAEMLELDPWNHWETLFRRDFGSATTLLEAMAVNPSAVAWHVSRNIGMLPANAWLATPRLPWLIPRLGLGLMVCVVVLVGVIRALRDAHQDERVTRVAILGSAVLASWAASALVIAPRFHYFRATAAILLVLTVVGWHRRLSTGAAMTAGSVLTGAVLIPIVLGTTEVILPNLATVRQLRAVGPKRPAVILEADFGRALYAGLPYDRLAQTDCIPFESCLRRHRPDVIVDDERLRSYYVADSTFQRFRQDPGDAGFNAVTITRTDVRIYVRRPPE